MAADLMTRHLAVFGPRTPRNRRRRTGDVLRAPYTQTIAHTKERKWESDMWKVSAASHDGEGWP